MAAVAKGRIAGLLAFAEIGFSIFFRLKRLGCKGATLVRTIAKGLIG
jgi:hypothetical protein